MAYTDRGMGGNQRLATMGVVLLIQGAVIVALVNGLAVKWTKPDVIPNPEAKDVPITMPVDIPPPPPKPPIEQRQHQDVEPLRPLPPGPTVFDLTPPPQPQPLPQPTTPVAFDPPVPPSPVPTGTPHLAKPRNAPGGWATDSDYPARDLRDGNQGLVGFRLAIGSDGRVQSCTVTRSSGFAGLDKATCDNVSRRARFEPATDAGGTRVAGSYSGTLRWVIPQD